MKTDIQTKLKTLFDEKIKNRKAMFIPIAGVAAFMLVGYAGVDHEKPEIVSSHIQIPYGEKLDTDAIDVVDNHDSRSELLVEADDDSLDVKQLGTYQVEVRATDQFNNTDVKTIQVDVVDEEAPKLKMLGANDGYYIEVPVYGSQDLSSYIKAVDNVDGDVTPFIESDKQLDTSKQGTQTINVSVSDNSGNTTEEAFKFFIADMQTPEITLKSGSDITVDYGSEFKWQDYVSISDNLDTNIEPKVEGTIDTKQLNQQKEMTIIATDGAGNSSKVTLNATVKDITGPNIVLSTNKVSVDKGSNVDLKSYITSAVDNLDGDMKDKIDPYLQPLYDALQDMIPAAKLKEYMELNVIQIAPLAFMRGRTLNDAVVILDEAQNTTTQQIKMFLTRMGMNTKMIVTGDMTQIDLPSSQTSGLIQALKILKGVKGISFIELNKKDIVRHKLVTRIVEAYEKFEEKQKTFHSCHSERSEKSENIKRIY